MPGTSGKGSAAERGVCLWWPDQDEPCPKTSSTLCLAQLPAEKSSTWWEEFITLPRPSFQILMLPSPRVTTYPPGACCSAVLAPTLWPEGVMRLSGTTSVLLPAAAKTPPGQPGAEVLMAVEMLASSHCKTCPLMWLVCGAHCAAAAFMSPGCALSLFVSTGCRGPSVQATAGSPTTDLADGGATCVAQARRVSAGGCVDDGGCVCAGLPAAWSSRWTDTRGRRWGWSSWCCVTREGLRAQPSGPRCRGAPSSTPPSRAPTAPTMAEKRMSAAGRGTAGVQAGPGGRQRRGRC